VDGHGVHGALDIFLRIGGPQIARLFQAESGGHVAVEGVVGRGLVGHQVGEDAALQDLRMDQGGVPDQADGFRDAELLRGQGQIQRLVQVRGHDLAVPGLDPLLDARGVHLHRQDHAVVHRGGQGLGPAHPAETAVRTRRPRRLPPKCLCPAAAKVS